MPLTDEDVREILRIIDESDLAELRIETEGFSLHVRKGGGGREARAALAFGRPESARRGRRRRPPSAAARPGAGRRRARSIPAPMLGTFYRAEAPGQAAVRRGGQRGSSPTRSSASSRS